MRLSTQQFYIQNQNSVARSNANMLKFQQQLASGQKIARPSDDPSGTLQINKLERVLARNEVFSRNIDVAERRLNTEETTLDLMIQTTLRIRDLALQARNGTLAEPDLTIIGIELEQLEQQLFSAANTKDAQGEYLFSGFRGLTQPYQINEDGNYEYMGDGGQRFLDVAENMTIATTDPGGPIFGEGEENLFNVVKELAIALKREPADKDFFKFQSEFLDGYLNSMIDARSKIGARNKVLENQREIIADIQLYTKANLSSIRDTDYYEATSQLLLSQTALEAAYSSFAKIQNLSLFNFIR